MFMHVCIVYIPVCSDFQPYYVFCSMPISKTSKLWPTFQIIRMCSCASCVSMLVLATCSTMRPCSRNLMHILALTLYLQTSMRWNVQLSLTVIRMCHASLGFAFLHIWSCSFTATRNQEFRYYSAMNMHILSCNVYVHVYIKYILVWTCIYILHGVLGRPHKKNQLVVCA